jgi:hypothetical protein
MYFDSSTDYVAGDDFGFGRYVFKHVLNSSVGRHCWYQIPETDAQ